MIQLGKIISEKIEDYHAAKAVSKSRIDVFRESPLLYEKRFVTKTVPAPEPTEAMIIGNAAGALILEGEKAFGDRYVILSEDAPKRPTKKQINAKKPSFETIEAIKFWEAFTTLTAGRTVLEIEQRALLLRMQESLNQNPEFALLTAAGQPEVTFRIQGSHFAVQVRPDWINEEGCALTDGYPYLMDLKTIDRLPCDEPDFLPWRIAGFGYQRQAYLYSEVVANVLKFPSDVPRPRFFFAFVEKQEPYDSVIVELSETDIEVGQREVTSSLTKLRRCYETGIWQSPRRGVNKLSLPFSYVRKSLELTDPNVEEVA